MIIDTPGFGDTNGVAQDDRTTLVFGRFFDKFKKENNKNQINSIVTIVNGTRNRISPDFRYNIERIKMLFTIGAIRFFTVVANRCQPGASDKQIDIIKALKEQGFPDKRAPASEEMTPRVNMSSTYSKPDPLKTDQQSDWDYSY